MRVKFVQSGGIVGGARACELYSDQLAPEEARELEALVRTSGLTRSGEFLSPGARDLRLYDIELVDERATVTVRFDDGTLPEQARALVSYLRRNSRPAAAGR